MRKLNNEMKNRIINYNQLIDFGFVENNDVYNYKELIYNNLFEVHINIKDDEVSSFVIEIEYGEEYVLVDVLVAQGDFVGKVRTEYEYVIDKFISECTSAHIFKSMQANNVINYIKNKYGDELEYLWTKFPKNAVWKNKDNQKWYGALLVISSNKIGIEPTKEIEIIDLRYQSNDIDRIIDNKIIFPGYHMNKKHWVTIVLDGRISDNEIFNFIDNSYKLIKNKK